MFRDPVHDGVTFTYRGALALGTGWGPNVFTLGGHHWMLVAEWRGLAVHRSANMSTWERHGLLLDEPGTRPDDDGIGLR